MPDQPNVLLVCTDHWPSALFAHRGHPAILTPTLDALARDGTVFTDCYSECPVCIPARRTLMTGTAPRSHGLRRYSDLVDMPALPTLAQCFRDAGYQAQAVGKLHVYPQRDRIGFDDVQLCEEGRMQFGEVDDYEQFLAANGHAGEQFFHCMSNNHYHVRPWHLDERLHPSNWATRELCRQIKRRDPTRPALWYIGYQHPHPPLAPLRDYLDMYRDVQPPMPAVGSWASVPNNLPAMLRHRRQRYDQCYGERETVTALRAFYALCTHIDHQLRLIIGNLREEGVLDNTIICFTADHGDMLGQHGLWQKSLCYDAASRVPMIVLGTAAQMRDGVVAPGVHDDRLCGLQDVMPTLLSLAGIAPPESVDGRCLATGAPREQFFCEIGEGREATRMIRRGAHKLIWYPVGQRVQLFDLSNDPHECDDLADSPTHADIRAELEAALIAELHDDEQWIADGKLVGAADEGHDVHVSRRALSGQRGLQYPNRL